MRSETKEEAEWNEVLEDAMRVATDSYNLFNKLRAMDEKGIKLNVENQPVDIIGTASNAWMHTHNLWIFIQHKMKS